MGVQELKTFIFTCDGYWPLGELPEGFVPGLKCDAIEQMSTPTQGDAETLVGERGWHEDARGWLCAVTFGHQGDPPPEEPEDP